MAVSYDRQGSNPFEPLITVAVEVLERLREKLKVQLATQRAWSKATPYRFAPYRVNATGRTSDSLSVVPTTHGAYLEGRAGMLNLEGGTPPGLRPDTGDLQRWADARGLGWDSSTTEFFADKIASQGDSLFRDDGREPFITPTIENYEQQLLQSVENSRVLNDVVVDLQTYLIN